MGAKRPVFPLRFRFFCPSRSFVLSDLPSQRMVDLYGLSNVLTLFNPDLHVAHDCDCPSRTSRSSYQGLERRAESGCRKFTGKCSLAERYELGAKSPKFLEVLSFLSSRRFAVSDLLLQQRDNLRNVLGLFNSDLLVAHD